LDQASTDAPVRVTVDDGESACLICFESEGDHVLMKCGHGGYCTVCAHKLFVRPPSLCPSCRGPLTGVVKVDLGTGVGDSSAVT
jgi:Zinc finger, C3HC4 type (RING finger)